MALETTNNRVSYAGNGTTDEFSFPNYFLADEDLVVIRRTDVTGEELLLTLTSDYTVAGEGNESGGTVSTSAPPATGTTLIIYRDPPILQDKDFRENDSFPAEQAEEALDKGAMISQRLAERVSRAVRLSDGFTDTFDLTLPVDLATDSAGKVLIVNEDEDGFEMGPSATDIEASAAAALASENAASASETAAANSETAAADSAAAALASENAASGFADDAAASAAEAAAGLLDGSVTNAKLADMAAHTIKGNAAGSPAAPTDLTAAQVSALLTTPTRTILASTGTTVGWVFTIGSMNATVGATYTNNGNTYTVLATIAAGSTLFCSGVSAPQASGTLTKASGTGDSSKSFTAAQALATYTTPADAKLLKVLVCGGGGGGGTGSSSAANCAAGSGGEGGSVTIKYIANPGATYYYAVGLGGASAVNGKQSHFTDLSAVLMLGQGGLKGTNGAQATTTLVSGAAIGAIVGSGGDVYIAGGPSGPGLIFAATMAVGGRGGGSYFGDGAPENATTTSATGTDGYMPGAGGAGGAAVGATSGSGGAGANGTIIIEEFYV